MTTVVNVNVIDLNMFLWLTVNTVDMVKPALYTPKATRGENGLNSTDEIYKQMGRLIRVRRKKIEVTQEELAQRINLTRTSITNIEKGRQKIQVHTLFDIAAALDVSPYTLLPIPRGQESETVKERVKGLKPDEREFARSVLTTKSEDTYGSYKEKK
jgi:transcriptional regulator with XRE-family HTH domain